MKEKISFFSENNKKQCLNRLLINWWAIYFLSRSSRYPFWMSYLRCFVSENCGSAGSKRCLIMSWYACTVIPSLSSLLILKPEQFIPLLEPLRFVIPVMQITICWHSERLNFVTLLELMIMGFAPAGLVEIIMSVIFIVLRRDEQYQCCRQKCSFSMHLLTCPQY